MSELFAESPSIRRERIVDGARSDRKRRRKEAESDHEKDKISIAGVGTVESQACMKQIVSLCFFAITNMRNQLSLLHGKEYVIIIIYNANF